MDTILVDKNFAEDIATRINKQSQDLASETSVSTDSQSTLSGSTKAIEMINAEDTIAVDISRLFIEAADKISLVCAEFQKKDDEIGKELSNSGTASEGFSINEPR